MTGAAANPAARAAEPPIHKDPHAAGYEDEIDLVDLIRYLWRRKWLLIVCGLLGVAIGVYVALTTPEEYEASTTLVPSEQDPSGLSSLSKNLGGLAALGGFSIGGGDTSKTPEALALLESRSFLAEFVADNQLLPLLFADKWDEDAQTWTAEALESPPTVIDGAQKIRDHMSVSESRESSLVTVKLTWFDRQLAADWVNQLIVRLNETMRRRAIVETRNNLDYLNSELEKTSVIEVKASIYGLIESQIKNQMIANVRKGYVFRVVEPAMPPQEDEPVKPKKPLIVVLGGMLGGMFGLGLLGLTALIRAVREDDAAA